MAELILEPYAVSQHWDLRADGKWETILSEYLETLARRCHEAGPCVVGHIKALALLPAGGYVQVSIEHITRETAAHVSARWQGEVIIKATEARPPSPTGLHTTHIHHEKE